MNDKLASGITLIAGGLALAAWYFRLERGRRNSLRVTLHWLRQQ